MVPFSTEKAEILARWSDSPIFPVYLMLSRSSLASILDVVRNKVLDWSLSLQAAGIKGEGMSFRPEEKAMVSGKGDTYNIGSIGSFAGNLGGSVGGSVSGSSTQNVREELEKVAALVGQIRQYQGQIGLDADREKELGRKVDAIDEEMRSNKPTVTVIGGLLKSIKSTLEGATGNLIAAGVLSAISNIRL
jgi:hypothetical protein